MSREAGSPGELIPGHRDQAKSQWAAGEVAAVISSSRLSPPKITELPFVFQPSSPVFSQHLSGARKTEPARTKVVCSPLA